ncbi:MAG: hypothetical protein WC479_08215 [Candidatus Izemoplasmatales bacterium]
MRKGTTLYDLEVKERKRLEKEIEKKDKTIWELSCQLSEIITIQEDTQKDLAKEIEIGKKLLKSAAVKNAKPPAGRPLK